MVIHMWLKCSIRSEPSDGCSHYKAIKPIHSPRLVFVRKSHDVNQQVHFFSDKLDRPNTLPRHVFSNIDDHLRFSLFVVCSWMSGSRPWVVHKSLHYVWLSLSMRRHTGYTRQATFLSSCSQWQGWASTATKIGYWRSVSGEKRLGLSNYKIFVQLNYRWQQICHPNFESFDNPIDETKILPISTVFFWILNTPQLWCPSTPNSCKCRKRSSVKFIF